MKDEEIRFGFKCGIGGDLLFFDSRQGFENAKKTRNTKKRGFGEKFYERKGDWPS